MKAGKQTCMKAWAGVWQAVLQSIHIYVLSLRIVHLRYNMVIKVNQTIFPLLPSASPLFSPAIFNHYNKLSISPSLLPLSLSLSWKSKQALVEQPHSLAPLTGQLSHKTSWCYGNSHSIECIAQHWCTKGSMVVAKVKECTPGNAHRKIKTHNNYEGKEKVNIWAQKLFSDWSWLIGIGWADLCEKIFDSLIEGW